MATLKPTRSEADELIAARKIITSSITWKTDREFLRLEAKALEPERQAIFRLVGCIGKRNYSFCLLYRNFPIRKFTKHAKHRFQGEEIEEPHKHVWDEVTNSSEVYIPDDINPNDNLNDQFLAFCHECNIELRGGYQRVIYELRR